LFFVLGCFLSHKLHKFSQIILFSYGLHGLTQIVVVFAGMGLKFALAFFMPQITQIFTNYFFSHGLDGLTQIVVVFAGMGLKFALAFLCHKLHKFSQIIFLATDWINTDCFLFWFMLFVFLATNYTNFHKLFF
jgi:hypothetical protein